MKFSEIVTITLWASLLTWLGNRVLNDPSSTNLFILVYSVLLYFNANQHDLWKKKEKP